MEIKAAVFYLIEGLEACGLKIREDMVDLSIHLLYTRFTNNENIHDSGDWMLQAFNIIGKQVKILRGTAAV